MTAQVMQRLQLTATAAHCAVAGQEIRALRETGDHFGWKAPWYEVLIRPLNPARWQPVHFIESLYAQRPVTDTDLEVLERASAWLRKQSQATRVNINVHPDSLVDQFFIKRALSSQEDAARFGHSLCLELIEFGECDQKSSLIQNANALRASGILIALDDFGSRLNCFDLCAAGIVDLIKIDTKVICGLEKDTNQRAIVESVQTLARGLSARVVAEGVETLSQLETVRAMGVELAQGFYFHRPQVLEA